jgi:hypothetical protein
MVGVVVGVRVRVGVVLGLEDNVAVGESVLVEVCVKDAVLLGRAVQPGVVVRAMGVLQAVSQQQNVKTTNNNLTFLLFADSKE